jgi:hypothetical protein
MRCSGDPDGGPAFLKAGNMKSMKRTKDMKKIKGFRNGLNG